jgi:signal transduction histidine kinase
MTAVASVPETVVGIAPPPRILIVDDALPDGQLVGIMLASEGYQLQIARSGAEALAQVAKEPPDLILLDVLMNGLDGYHVASALKADSATRDIPIIMLTALDDREARLKGLNCGAEDFLTKPLDCAELRVRVRNLLRLKSCIAELDQTNSEIAAALDEAREARREAEEANGAKSLFLRVMSHELRTPLNAISGYTQLLELGVRGAMTPEQRHDVGRIRSAATYLTRLINDVLTAKNHAVAKPLELAAIAVRSLFADVHGLCALQAESGGLTLAFASPAPDVFVTADTDGLQQILINLVTNAIKFTPRGGRVSVDCSRHDTVVDIRVSDTGIGIEPADGERVFEPFVQIDKRLAHGTEGGVGLGLSISRQLARAMNGDVVLRSTPGAGATFTLTLPEAIAA